MFKHLKCSLFKVASDVFRPRPRVLSGPTSRFVGYDLRVVCLFKTRFEMAKYRPSLRMGEVQKPHHGLTKMLRLWRAALRGCAVLSALANLMGCASSDRQVASSDDSEVSVQSYAHPATVVNDNFQVNRKMPDHPGTPGAVFFFKRCNMAGDDLPRSRTVYDCSSP